MDHALLELEELKRRQNEELLSVLEEEQSRENEREGMLSKVQTHAVIFHCFRACLFAGCADLTWLQVTDRERRRLDKIFEWSEPKPTNASCE